jgi:hypothetical protein
VAAHSTEEESVLDTSMMLTPVRDSLVKTFS